MFPLLLLALVATDPDAAIHLTCGGSGAATRVETGRAFAGDNNGNTAWVTTQHRGSQDFADQVDLIIDGQNSRIRLPRIMLPPIHGGDSGWFKMKDVKVEPKRITGSAAINFINSPKVFVDRQTGTISIEGKAGHYSGQCERAASADQPTRF